MMPKFNFRKLESTLTSAEVTFDKAMGMYDEVLSMLGQPDEEPRVIARIEKFRSTLDKVQDAMEKWMNQMSSYVRG